MRRLVSPLFRAADAGAGMDDRVVDSAVGPDTPEYASLGASHVLTIATALARGVVDAGGPRAGRARVVSQANDGAAPSMVTSPSDGGGATLARIALGVGTTKARAAGLDRVWINGKNLVTGCDQCVDDQARGAVRWRSTKPYHSWRVRAATRPTPSDHG